MLKTIIIIAVIILGLDIILQTAEAKDILSSINVSISNAYNTLPHITNKGKEICIYIICVYTTLKFMEWLISIDTENDELTY